MKRLSFAVLVCVLCVGVSQAVLIDWEPGVYAYAAGDETAWVSTEGDLVYAMNCLGTVDEGDSGSSTIIDGTTVSYAGFNWVNTGEDAVIAGATQNGITITSNSDMGDTIGFQSGQFTNDPDYFYSGGFFRVLGLEISGLTEGQEYQLQIMGNDSDHSGEWWAVFSDGTQGYAASAAAGTAGVLPTVTTAAGQGGAVIGSFTADATGILTLNAHGAQDTWNDFDCGTWVSNINALQIREVPEPATLLLLGLGGLVLRKRK